MSKKIIAVPFGESSPKVFEDVDMRHLDSKVRFSFKHRVSDKKYCVTNGASCAMGGISIEKKNSGNHSMLKSINNFFSTFLH